MEGDARDGSKPHKRTINANFLATMEAQLQSRVAVPSKDATPDLTPCLSEDSHHTNLYSWLGRYPTAAEICDAMQASWDALEGMPMGVGIAQLQSPETVAHKTIVALGQQAFADVPRAQQLLEVYDRTQELMEANRIDAAQLKVCSMVCAGGMAWWNYGLGGLTVEEAAQNQLHIVQKYGVLFDLVPLFLTDFDNNILGLGLGVAALLLCRLRSSQLCRTKLDGILFACKGTLAAAIALKAAGCAEGIELQQPLALVGFGTDLTQGFADSGITSLLQEHGVVKIINSTTDENLDHLARLRLEEWIAAQTEGCVYPHTSVMYDIAARLECLGWAADPGHNWYSDAFSKPAACELQAELLDHICGTVAELAQST